MKFRPIGLRWALVVVALAAVALVNEIKAKTATLLVARGAMPPVLTSPSVVGREASERLFDDAYAEHARRASKILRGAE